MSLRKIVAKQLAIRAQKKINKWAENPIETQQQVLKQLLQTAKHTAFGKDHGFDSIQTHKDFIEHVPIVDYEGLRPYICLLYTSPSPRDPKTSRMPSSA